MLLILFESDDLAGGGHGGVRLAGRVRSAVRASLLGDGSSERERNDEAKQRVDRWTGERGRSLAIRSLPNRSLKEPNQARQG